MPLSAFSFATLGLSEASRLFSAAPWSCSLPSFAFPGCCLDLTESRLPEATRLRGGSASLCRLRWYCWGTTLVFVICFLLTVELPIKHNWRVLLMEEGFQRQYSMGLACQQGQPASTQLWPKTLCSLRTRTPLTSLLKFCFILSAFRLSRISEVLIINLNRTSEYPYHSQNKHTCLASRHSARLYEPGRSTQCSEPSQ